jgi:predicted acylesterase/phospholipase RssA
MNSPRKKIGLALSGGGFRASLYHLGVARFLRDAGLLSQVSHITAVSGGSIFGAHLVLNWARYNGSASDFEAAAAEFLTFVRLDIRNRIFRRFPLMLLVRLARRLLGRSNRKLTRTGLLEREYQNNLYGDVSLFELPETPEIHFLATNVSEGCLCSFNRNGLLMVHRRADDSLYMDHVHVGLATVAMAVTASSAFPGFFPPLELTGTDVGANSGEFGRQAYTDGGVFDNLGVRMFRCLELLLPEDKRLALDGVLVSDVGKRFEVQGQQRRAGGVIRTALRASDIVMDRVWQLETETFKGTPGFVFAPMTDVVDRAEDPTALHAEIQRQAANIRTDLDRFSDLEISSLVQHGYGVARKACGSLPDLFGADLPKDMPWDPIPAPPAPAPAPSATKRSPWQTAFALLSKFLGRGKEPAEATVNARTLQASAVRRIWSTLLDYRDWTSYVYMPVIVPILVLTPYFAYRFYEHSAQVKELMQSISQSTPDLDRMRLLLEQPMTHWTGDIPLEIGHLDKPDNKRFEVLQDMHIFDLRNWVLPAEGMTDSHSILYGYRRLKIWKLPEETAGGQVYRFDLLPVSPQTQVRFPPQEVQPKLLVSREEDPATGQKRCHWEASVDFSRVPDNDLVDVLEEHLSPGDFLEHHGGSTTLRFEPSAETAELTRWILMPQGREYKSWRLMRYEKSKPEKREPFKPATEYLATNYKILAFKLLALKPGYVYELTWFYK